MKIFRWCLALLPFLLWAILFVPKGMTLMIERNDPWYTPYTTPLWFIAAAYFFPITVIMVCLGIKLLTTIHIIGMLVYAGLTCLVQNRKGQSCKKNSPLLQR